MRVIFSCKYLVSFFISLFFFTDTEGLKKDNTVSTHHTMTMSIQTKNEIN